MLNIIYNNFNLLFHVQHFKNVPEKHENHDRVRRIKILQENHQKVA